MSGAVDFEARYRVDPDPWRYATSGYERRKYAATLAACGPGPFARALELGGSIGVFSALLAPRCAQLDTIDAAPTAVAAARERLASVPGVQVRLGSIPQDVPPGPYQLVVASEILYYLAPVRLASTFERIGDVLAPGGRLVAVHWRPPGPERPHTAEQIHRMLHRQAWLTPTASHPHPQYLLDVFARR